MHYHFEGRLTARDCKRHISHVFTVPAEAGQIDIRLHFAPARVHGLNNMISLTVFDPAGFRGAGHRGGDIHGVHISAAAATPGYAAGPLPAGTWIAEIDTHMIMPGEPVQYLLDITVTADAPDARAADPAHQARLPRQPRRGPGWYRGDLHSHTYHSDAKGRSVAELIEAARTVGLDFVFLTDHNTVTGLAEMDDVCSDDLLTTGGIELTTFWGHALCLGTRRWVDWRIRPGTGDMARIAAATYAAGQLFIIAHPTSLGDPGCTGCSWRYGEMMPGNARLVEIWNGPWGNDSINEAALVLWYDWLNQGLRLAATAGSDTHGARDYAAGPGFNVVFAEELSEAALLKAVAAGHLYLSAGPRVSFQAQEDGGATAISGDTVTRPAAFTVAWEGCPAGAHLRLIANGRLLDLLPAGPSGEHMWRMAPDQADWMTIELRDRDRAMLAVANPIFLHNIASGGDS